MGLKVKSIMKRSILVLSLLVLISCENNEQDEPSNYVSALKNNLEWSATPEIQFAGDTLIIFGITSKPNDEGIVMKIKFEGTGEYVLTNDQAYYFLTIGGDVSVGEYKTAPGTTGKIKISKYDEVTRTIEGTFEVQLKQEWSNPKNEIDFLDFKNGFFRGKISQ